MPLEELLVRTVGTPFWKRDRLAGPSIEGFAVTELCTQLWTNPQPVLQVKTQISAVEECVYVGSEQQSVVEPVPPRGSPGSGS